MIFCHLLIYSKSAFSKNSFRNTIRVSNSLDRDQARHFVGPDLGPNCLQQIPADAYAGKFLVDVLLLHFLLKYFFFLKNLEILSECQTVWIVIRWV